ncbi:MAG TPA: amidohydrolase family protein [Stellaceae bacterium]|nr:amidohydrolase family protein [Stellaceae bacterium]
MAVFDTHAHVIAPDLRRYPRNPVGGHASEWSKTRPVDADAMLKAMDAAGVARTVLVQASTCYGYDNSYVANAVIAHPDRFTGVASIDTLEDDAVTVLKHWLESGITGLRIFTTGSNMGGQQLEILDDPRSFAVWEYAQQIDLPICLQMQAKALPQVEMLAQRFPRVRILLDHLARPDLADGPPYGRAASLWALARFPNIYLKASPHTFAAAKTGQATPASFFRRVVDEFGAQRIFWGSNFPAAEGTLADLLALARENFATLSADEQAWIFSKTALSLYPALGK